METEAWFTNLLQEKLQAGFGSCPKDTDLCSEFRFGTSPSHLLFPDIVFTLGQK